VKFTPNQDRSVGKTHLKKGWGCTQSHIRANTTKQHKIYII